MGDIIKMTPEQARREKQSVEADPELIAVLEGLREFVDNINRAPSITLRGQTYRAIDLSRMIQSVAWNGVEVGYRLRDSMDGMIREVFVRFEQPIMSIPEEERDPIILAVFDVFLMEGQGEV